MTQQWGTPGQQPNPGAQQWTSQPGWNRPTQVWGPPVTGAPPQYAQPQYPPTQPPYPQAAVRPQVPYGPPQAQFGQPVYGQPGGFPPANRGNPPGGPRRSSFRGVLLGLVLVIGIGFFAISLLHYLDAGAPDAIDNPRVTPTAPAVAVPAPDTDPPELPAPETYEEAQEWLTNNAAYAQTAPVPTDCRLPPIDPAGASDSELETHLDDLTACLWRVWSPPLEAAGFQLPRPPVTIYAQEITTPCGTQPEFNASYCGANQHIYYDRRVYEIFPKDLQKVPFLVETVLGHEFGHTIQARTGILVASNAWEARAEKTSEAAARVYSRRLEVQADCFAGTFTVAIGAASGLSADNLTSLRKVAYNLGDDVLSGKANIDSGHGLGKSRMQWFTKGQENNLMGTCNTYTVPASQVR
ncbi:MAG: neutral zinc metallopeptidase [Propionicimonas sp.]